MNSHVLKSNLDQALKKSYKVFSSYVPSRGDVDQPCGVSDQSFARLSEVPLTSLTWEDFGRYPFKALTTWGDLDLFKHYLPRLLQLLVVDWDGCDEVAVFLDKLVYGEFDHWPAKERQAVLDVLEWLFAYFLAEGLFLQDDTCALREGCIDLIDMMLVLTCGTWEYRDQFIQLSEPLRSRYFAVFVCDQHCGRKRENLDSFSRIAHKEYAVEFLKWLFADFVGDLLALAVLEEKDLNWVQYISEAYECWAASNWIYLAVDD